MAQAAPMDTTRRALFAGAAAIAALAVPAATVIALGGGASLASMWDEITVLEARDPMSDAECDRIIELENAILAGGPIRSRADAVAKLRAAARTFEVGERMDGADEAAVFDVIRWIERV